MTNVGVAIDLGGSWLRIRVDGQVTVQRSPSILNFPDDNVGTLVDELVEMVCAQIPLGACVAMSCGAAMDEHRCVVYGSGPLWGRGFGEPLRLRDRLVAERPDVRWTLVNDVTAGLANFVERFSRPEHRHVAYMTISTGIALRTADLTDRTIAVDDHGLQGEVGHLPAPAGRIVDTRLLPCACGGVGHVSSVSAGASLTRVAAMLNITALDTLRDDLPKRLADGDRSVEKLLTVVVEPIAELVRTLWCLDPRMDLIGIGGGMAEGLSGFYGRELSRQLSERRSYADQDVRDDRVEQRIRVCDPGDVNTLDGAMAMARGALTITKI